MSYIINVTDVPEPAGLLLLGTGLAGLVGVRRRQRDHAEISAAASSCVKTASFSVDGRDTFLRLCDSTDRGGVTIDDGVLIRRDTVTTDNLTRNTS